MNTLFENEYILTKELSYEISKVLVSKKYKVYCYVFALISLIMGLDSLIIDWDITFSIIFFGFVIYFIAMALNVYKFTAKKFYEHQRVVNNYEILRKIIYFDNDKIEVISPNGGKTIIFYQNIKNIYKTNNFFILNSENKVAVPVKIDGFIKGSCEDFEKFIFSKSQIS